jgi:hypothetical protein
MSPLRQHVNSCFLFKDSMCVCVCVCVRARARACNTHKPEVKNTKFNVGMNLTTFVRKPNRWTTGRRFPIPAPREHQAQTAEVL